MTGTLILVRHGAERVEPQEPVHRLAQPRPHRTRASARRATAGKRAQGRRHTRRTVYFTSALKRAQHTLDLILEEMGIIDVTITRNHALNERDYGDLAGLNKDDARAKWGEEQVLIWRRSYDVPPPGGESLKDTAARTLPYYDAEIVPLRDAPARPCWSPRTATRCARIVMAIEELTPEADPEARNRDRRAGDLQDRRCGKRRAGD